MHQLLLELITTQTTMFKLVVLSVVLAVAAANPNGVWGAGLGWTAPWGAGVAAPSASSVFNPLVGHGVPVPRVGAFNYRGPVSLPPGQPATILGADGRPLDTVSVNLAKDVHYTARALEGRRLQKRSIFTSPLVATNLAATNSAVANLATNNLATAQITAGPLGAGALVAGPLATTSLVATPLTLGRSWVGPAPIAPAAISVAAPFAPFGFGVNAAASVGNI